MSDAIIVPGRGIEQDGILPADPMSRVRKAVELFQINPSAYVVMSGKWSYHFRTEPARTEASAMQEYAISLGVPADKILLEDQSMDTLGNAYFSKKSIIEPHGWRTATVVASDDHMPRIEYIFNKIYGPEYTFSFERSERVIDEEQYARETQHEKQSLDITKRWLDDIPNGDDTAIWKLLSEHHPAYKRR